MGIDKGGGGGVQEPCNLFLIRVVLASKACNWLSKCARSSSFSIGLEGVERGAEGVEGGAMGHAFGRVVLGMTGLDQVISWELRCFQNVLSPNWQGIQSGRDEDLGGKRVFP